METLELQLKFFHRPAHLALSFAACTANGIVPREEITTSIEQCDTNGKEHTKPTCRSLCLPRRRQGKSRPSRTEAQGRCDRSLVHGMLTIGSYGLFKATDKKMLKNEELAAELGRPEKVVEM